MKKNYITIGIIIAFFGLLTAGSVFAVDYKIEFPLPGMPVNPSFSDPGQYVKYLFIFGLSLAGFLAVGAIALGGINYMLAGASIGNVQKAKDLIIGALSGIALLLCSWLLLATIDPTLTNLSLQELAKIDIPPHEGLTFTDQEIETSTIAKGNYKDLINAAASKYNVPPNLIRAIIMAESGGNANAKSGPGAQGLMQLMPATAKGLGVKDPYDPAQNIEGGTKYVSQLLKRYNGDTSKALAAYNWGMGNVEKKGMNSLPPETQKYIPKVTRYWTNFENKA